MLRKITQKKDSFSAEKKHLLKCYFRFRNKTKFQEQLLILMETEFLEHETTKPFFWLRYIDDIFLIRTLRQEKFERFLNRINEFHPILKYTNESSLENINFLDVVISKASDGRLIFTVNPRIVINISMLTHVI